MSACAIDVLITLAEYATLLDMKFIRGFIFVYKAQGGNYGMGFFYSRIVYEVN